MWNFAPILGCDSQVARHAEPPPRRPDQDSIVAEGQVPFSHVTIAMSPGWGGLLRHATFDENGVLTKSQFWGIPRISRQLTVFLTLSNPTDSMRTLYFRWEVGIHAEVNLPPLATLQSTLVDSVVG